MSGKQCECCCAPLEGTTVEHAIELTRYDEVAGAYVEDERLVICPRCYGLVASAAGVERMTREAEQS